RCMEAKHFVMVLILAFGWYHSWYPYIAIGKTHAVYSRCFCCTVSPLTELPSAFGIDENALLQYRLMCSSNLRRLSKKKPRYRQYSWVGTITVPSLMSQSQSRNRSKW